MGRPKKAEEGPDACQRIIDAFWSLLEERQLHEITVGALTQRAQCNRGTFYYHYQDFDELVFKVIEDELVGSGTIARIIFLLSAGQCCERALSTSAPHLRRMALVAQKGGLDAVLLNARDAVMGFWQAALCTEGGSITPQATSIIEFNVSGALGLLVLSGSRGVSYEALFKENLPFLQHNAVAGVAGIARAQGMSEDIVLERLDAVRNAIGFQEAQRPVAKSVHMESA